MLSRFVSVRFDVTFGIPQRGNIVSSPDIGLSLSLSISDLYDEWYVMLKELFPRRVNTAGHILASSLKVIVSY